MRAREFSLIFCSLFLFFSFLYIGVRGTYLRSLELLGLGSDELLEVIAKNCNNLEILNIKGSREAVTDRGFSRYVNQASPEAKANLMQLNISRCMLTQVTLTHLQNLNGELLFFKCNLSQLLTF